MKCLMTIRITKKTIYQAIFACQVPLLHGGKHYVVDTDDGGYVLFPFTDGKLDSSMWGIYGRFCDRRTGASKLSLSEEERTGDVLSPI